jgi:hypothetical protein
MTAEEWEGVCAELFNESSEGRCDENWLEKFGFA